MKTRWILKKDLKTLRDRLGISMSALAKLAFTTDTTIFRIEKTGVVSDESLAHMLSDVLEIPFDKLYMKKCQEEEAKVEWERNLKEVYETQPNFNKVYYVAFVTRYECGKNYHVLSPTNWISTAEGSSELRGLVEYYPNGIIEYLEKQSVKCAVVHDEISLIYFYYGLEDMKQTAMLIGTDIAKEIYPHLKTNYLVKEDDMVDCCGFNDCVPVALVDDDERLEGSTYER